MRASRVHVVHPESSLIGIEPFDSAVHPNFVATIERLQNPPHEYEIDIAGYSVVITNHTQHSIESLVIGWKVAGESKPKHLILEGYWNPPRTPILAPRKQLLVNPSGTLPTILPESFLTFSLPGPLGFFPRSKIVDGKLQLERRDDLNLEASIDSAIFEDGTMIGPDRFGIVAWLRERQSAVKALVARIDEGVASGKSIDDALSDFPITEDRRQHAQRLVHQLRRNHAFLEFLKQVRELPPNHP